MTSQPTPAELVEIALASAEPGVELVAIVDEEHRGNLRWAQNGLTTNGLTRSRSLTVVAVVPGPDGARTATVSRTGASVHSVSELVAAATRTARASMPSTSDGAVELVDGGVDRTFDDAAHTMTPAVFDPLVPPLAQALRRARQEGATWSGYAEAALDSTWLGTTAGTRRLHHQPSGRLELTARSVRADGQVVSAWAGAACESFDEVSVPDLEAELAQGRRWSATDVDVEPGRHRVILTASAVADLVIPALWSASARDAVEGRSAFAAKGGGARIGEPVMGPGVEIASDPFDPVVPTRPFVLEHASGPTSSVLDNGVELRRTAWIKDGRLQHLIGPRSFDATLHQTARSIDNVLITTPGRGSLSELIARTDDALLITCFWYIRDVDPQTLLLTGLTRDGVYRVRNGKVVGAAPNFRFNVSPLEVMSSIVDGTAAARTQPREWGDYVHRVVAPALVVDGFNLSTRSDAR